MDITLYCLTKFLQRDLHQIYLNTCIINTFLPNNKKRKLPIIAGCYPYHHQFPLHCIYGPHNNNSYQGLYIPHTLQVQHNLLRNPHAHTWHSTSVIKTRTTYIETKATRKRMCSRCCSTNR